MYHHRHKSKQQHSEESNYSDQKHEHEREHEPEQCAVECDDGDCDGSIITDNKTGEQYCNSCGLVVKSIVVDHGPEWHASDAADAKRTGSTITQLRHDQGIGSVISYNNRDGYGKTIKSGSAAAMSRQRVLNSRAKSGGDRERTLRKALTEILRMGSALGVPKSAQEVAGVIFRRAHKDNLLIGRSVEGVSTACLYAACRIESISRSLDEVSKVSRVGKTEIKNCYLYINKTLKLEVPPANPIEYTGRMGSALEIEQEYTAEANQLIKVCRDHDFMIGRRPTCIAAGTLYAVLVKRGVEYNQEQFASDLETNANSVREIAKYVLNADPELASIESDFEDMRIEKAREVLQKAGH